MKIRGQPHNNHINLIFSGKFVVFFSSPSTLRRVKTFKGPHFAPAPPPHVFERSLIANYILCDFNTDRSCNFGIGNFCEYGEEVYVGGWGHDMREAGGMVISRSKIQVVLRVISRSDGRHPQVTSKNWTESDSRLIKVRSEKSPTMSLQGHMQKNAVHICSLQHAKYLDQGGFLWNQHLFFAQFTTFALHFLDCYFF